MRTPVERPSARGTGTILSCSACGAELGGHVEPLEGGYLGTVLSERVVRLDGDEDGMPRYGLRSAARQGHGAARRSRRNGESARTVGQHLMSMGLIPVIATTVPAAAEPWTERSGYRAWAPFVIYCPRPGCEAKHLVVRPTRV